MPAVAHEGREAARGVSRFLAAHEPCSSGFAIARNGRGRLHLFCSGCGNHIQYGESDAEELKAHGLDPEEMAGDRKLRPERETLERWLPAPAALPWWVPNAYIVAVILIGLGMVGFGLFQRGDDKRATLGDENPPAQAPPSSPPAQAPVPAQAGVAGATARGGSGGSGSGSARELELDRISVLGRFSVGVPEGWDAGTSGGAIVVSSAPGNAELRVYLEPGATRPEAMSDQAAEFLSDHHPGAKITKPSPFRLGRTHAVRLVSTYRGGSERATLLVSGGYSYLLLSRVDSDAESAERRGSEASLQSFRPR